MTVCGIVFDCFHVTGHRRRIGDFAARAGWNENIHTCLLFEMMLNESD